MEGTHQSVSTHWNYEKEIVVVAYDPGYISPADFEEKIKSLGYRATSIRLANAEKKESSNSIKVAPIKKDYPAFYLNAMARAKNSKRILIVDFWAPWCTPCKRLKHETISDKSVQKLLGDIEVVYVNLDEHPLLGKAFGVSTMPDVFFIEPDGKIADRLKEFEAPSAFKKRLHKILGR